MQTKNLKLKNINNLLNHSQNKLFNRNLKNNIKKKKFFHLILVINQKIIIYSIKNNKYSFEKNGAKLYEFFKNENLNKIHIFGDTMKILTII